MQKLGRVPEPVAEESGAAFLGSRAGYACVVTSGPAASMVVVHPCAAQTAIQCWWQIYVELCPFSLKALYAFVFFCRRVGPQGCGGSPSSEIPE